jgi:hypothetical protein
MTDTIKIGLSRAVRRLMRPLVRLLLGQGISYSEFAELAKHVFVESAARDFDTENSEVSNENDISALSGLTIGEVRKILAYTLKAESGLDRGGAGLDRILQAWHTEQEFIGPYGMPLELPWDADDRPSFSMLVLRAGGELNANQALKALMRAGAVSEIEPKYYKVLGREYLPRALDPIAVEHLGVGVASFMETIVGNLEGRKPSGPKLQRIVYADNPIPIETTVLFDAWIKREGQRFLEQIDDWFIAQNRDDADPQILDTTEKKNTGVGIYHYETGLEEEIPFADLLRKSDYGSAKKE